MVLSVLKGRGDKLVKRETFIQILSSLLAEADATLLTEASNLIYGRRRTLRQELVNQYWPGQIVTYQEPGDVRRCAIVSHLNQFSLSVKLGNGQTKPINIEYVEGLTTGMEEGEYGWSVTAEAIANQYDRYARHKS
jgi:hypothetical protein